MKDYHIGYDRGKVLKHLTSMLSNQHSDEYDMANEALSSRFAAGCNLAPNVGETEIRSGLVESRREFPQSDSYSPSESRYFNFTAWFQTDDNSTPDADHHAKKLSSVHSEADCFSHHQEPDYHHHTHYLHHHHQHTFTLGHPTHKPQTESSHPDDADPLREVPSSSIFTELANSSSPDRVPHFKDDYPHFHHYHHHCSGHHNHPNHLSRLRTPAKSTLDHEMICGKFCPSNSQDRLECIASGEVALPVELDRQDTPHEALYKLRLRVMDWLEGIQEHVKDGADSMSELDAEPY